ncbi:hypothetical protein TSTA_012450 [Talaromyces stipitatus ATCC 10500]|uniref:Uncharacterized protein n=1 Tax=Talaromyces stipitatus (strain ATCC 10500 / CBS 375.48 / QM 6759 / NRRL 1006) TaxID=441959 RepID=B8MF37_TALSN|nr:uncharacterized protein TSTA_012450 [Talaromyces stipitatus ATCC 10500]EED16136.1 hypothetical protein TSTA_012450 [Talaromyces stipitatus ATCC 10500]
MGESLTPYYDGGLNYNNHIHPLMHELSSLWPSRKVVACIVSIDTGVPPDRNVGLLKINYFKDLITQTANTARNFQQGIDDRYGPEKKIYFRFNVEHGLGQIDLAEWRESDSTKNTTQCYLNEQLVKVGTCADRLLFRGDVLHDPLQQTQPEQHILLVHALGGTGKSQLRTKKFLLVFDGADVLNRPEISTSIDLTRFMPLADSVDIVITTRQRVTKIQGRCCVSLAVGDMKEGDAVKLLLDNAHIEQDSIRQKRCNIFDLMATYNKLGKYTEAIATCTEKKENTAPRSSRHHSSLTYADVPKCQGRVPEAAAIHEEGLPRMEKKLGHNHIDTLCSTVKYGYEFKLGSFKERLFKEFLELKAKTVSDLQLPADIIYSKSNAIFEVEKLQREAVERIIPTFGEGCPATIHAMERLAGTLEDLGEMGEAGAIRRDV